MKLNKTTRGLILVLSLAVGYFVVGLNPNARVFSWKWETIYFLILIWYVIVISVFIDNGGQ